MRPSIGLRLLPAAGAAMVLAACGSSSGTPPPTGGETTQVSTTTSTVAAPTSAAGSSAAGSSATATPATAATATSAPQGTAALASRGCGSGQISVSAGASTAGLGHLAVPLRFQNIGSAPCSVRGYPGVALIRIGGRELQVTRTPNGYLGGLSASAASDPVIRLRPRQTGSALLEGVGSTSSGQVCPHYEALLVTPPNQTATSRLARPLSICDPEIHPVVGGTSGSQAP
jgi:Protein of unknown function (DUF4232)